MEAGGGTIVGKAGAEGVYCVGLPEAGIGLALKVDDGNARAAYPAVVEALRQAGLVSDRVVESLRAFHNPELKNHKGTIVGEIVPVLRLHKVV
jgi:L-asparaginase II